MNLEPIVFDLIRPVQARLANLNLGWKIKVVRKQEWKTLDWILIIYLKLKVCFLYICRLKKKKQEKKIWDKIRNRSVQNRKIKI